MRLCCGDSCRTEQNVVLPEPGRYATGILFVDKDADKAAAVERMFEQLAQQANLQVAALLPTYLLILITTTVTDLLSRN